MTGDAVRELSTQLRDLDDRLGRLLASGWRHAAPEAASLAADADLLSDAGIVETAARLRAVADARDAAEALPTIALAASAVRLLRARLPLDAPPEDAAAWSVVGEQKTAKAETDTLVLLCRVLFGGREMWACARPERGQWLLVQPPFEPPPPPTSGPASGLLGRLHQHLGGGSSDAGPWLRQRLRGRLVWQARHPVGADDDVAECRLEDAERVDPPEEKSDLLASFRRVLAAGPPRDPLPVFVSWHGLQVRRLERADADTCVWLDPSMAEAFRAAASGPTWALARVSDDAVAPLAVLVPGGKLSSARLVHLLPGLQETRLG